MNVIIASCVTLLLAGASQVALAGSVTWEVTNHASGVSDETVKAAVRRGIAASDPNLSLPKPWKMDITVSGGSQSGEPLAGLILIQKIKSAGKDGWITKCQKMEFGTYVSGSLIASLEKVVTVATGYFAQDSDCN
jgi:hypothetical protein